MNWRVRKINELVNFISIITVEGVSEHLLFFTVYVPSSVFCPRVLCCRFRRDNIISRQACLSDC